MLASMADAQHGVVARHQLLTAGFPDGWIREQVTLESIHVMSEGVYAVGHRRLSRRGRAWAALLRAGEGSVISHLSCGPRVGAGC